MSVLEDLGGKLPSPQQDSPLLDLAKGAAEAFDAYAEARARLEARREAIMARVNEELAELSARVSELAKPATEAKTALLEAMREASVSEVAMPDRPPIRLKTRKGSKKACTKKYLTSYFTERERSRLLSEGFEGDADSAAKSLAKQTVTRLWDRLPRNKDTVSIEIPDLSESYEPGAVPF